MLAELGEVTERVLHSAPLQQAITAFGRNLLPGRTVKGQGYATGEGETERHTHLPRVVIVVPAVNWENLAHRKKLAKARLGGSSICGARAAENQLKLRGREVDELGFE